VTAPLWLTFEAEVLDELGVGSSFSAVSLANDLGIDGADASRWIQNYLSAQRGKRSQTKYVLYRQDRTSAAVWTIGKKTKDARARLAQFGDDVQNTMRRAVRPDIHRLAEINPKVARAVDEVLDPLIDSVGKTVHAVMMAVGFDRGEDEEPKL
jgi:hypothetical protein